MGVSNPFTSKTFVNYWIKHFKGGVNPISHGFLNEVDCYQSKIPGLYINVGKNLTKGISYAINATEKKELRGKTYLLYDVFPDLVQIGPPQERKSKELGRITIQQYPGYLIDLRAFNGLEEYMSATFKKSSRYKLRKYKKRLEECFDISFKSFGTDISKEEYDFIFHRFRVLLEKRFSEKKIHNNNLEKSEWDFYKDVAYPLIKEGQATLFVLYNGNQPISVTLGYLFDKRILDSITVFDIDYAKFHLGSLKIMYLIDWAITNKWEILDFSKGHFDYKTRWSNVKYYFHYHVLFDKESLYSKLLAHLIKHYFTLKKYLRDKRFNELLHRLRYRLKKNAQRQVHYSFTAYDSLGTKDNMQVVDIQKPSYSFLKHICYNFLYLYQENEKDLKVYEVNNPQNQYVLEGQKTTALVQLTL